MISLILILLLLLLFVLFVSDGIVVVDAVDDVANGGECIDVK